MTNHHSKYTKFSASEAGMNANDLLQKMVNDKAFTTKTTYTADNARYPDNRLPFVDKHMNYLSSHPNLNPTQYIANLRLITRKR